MTCPTCAGIGQVEKLGLFGFKVVVCKTCRGRGSVPAPPSTSDSGQRSV